MLSANHRKQLELITSQHMSRLDAQYAFDRFVVPYFANKDFSKDDVFEYTFEYEPEMYQVVSALWYHPKGRAYMIAYFHKKATDKRV